MIEPMTSGAAGGTVTTLRVGRAGAARPWVLTDDAGTALAEARQHVRTPDLTVDLGGRRLTARIAETTLATRPTTFDVLDDAGHVVVDATRTHGGRDRRGLVAEEWAVTVAGAAPIDWIQRLGEPRALGFHRPDGTPLLTLGHDPSFTANQGDRWWRILFRLWRGAIESHDRYLVQVHEPVAEAPLLAVLGVWLERTASSRYPSTADLG